MEVFTDVQPESFRTGLPPFLRPTGTKTGFERCIAVTSKEGKYLTAVYSVLVTLLFVVSWKLLSMVVMLASDALAGPIEDLHRYNKKEEEDRQKQTEGASIPVSQLEQGSDHHKEGPSRVFSTSYRDILRGMVLVGFWNAREPLEAFLFLLGYLGRPRKNLDKKRSPGRSLAIKLLIVAGVSVAGTYTASVMVAEKLIAGEVAPANPRKVFVPKSAGMDSADIMRLQALRAPATLRSLGSAEAASNSHTIRERFSFNPYPLAAVSPQYFTYQYTVNAHDMGLQKWYDLKQEVSGRCDFDNSWLWKNVPEEDLDVYRPWGLLNTTINVVYDGERKTAPSATAISFPYAQSDFLVHQAVEHRYGIIVHSSHRASHRPGTDPWYKTEPFTPSENDTDARITDPPANRVVGGRPALSCKQKDVWSYNGTRFKNIYELTDKANINFPNGWVTQLQMDFQSPRIIDVINSAGSSSLVSSATFVGGRFDAETATMANDMKRLLTATWISSAHTFRNMVMVSDQQNIPNAALKGTEQPQDGVGLFVVSTPQVATLRLSVLVTIPALLVSFILAQFILVWWGRELPWYESMHFAEGAVLYALTQDPEICVEPEWGIKLGKVAKNCGEKTQSKG